jgi:hypothetical protein
VFDDVVRKAKEEKSNKPPQSPIHPTGQQAAREDRKPHLLVKLVGFLLAVLGAAAAVLAFLPRVLPSISEPTIQGQPFSASVTITNTGSIPLQNVSVGLGINEICPANSPCNSSEFPTPGANHSGNLVQRVGRKPRDLGIDERFTFPLNEIIDTQNSATDYANIAIVVDYEIPIIKWKREKIYPLYTRKDNNGHIHWFWE